MYVKFCLLFCVKVREKLINKIWKLIFKFVYYVMVFKVNVNCECYSLCVYLFSLFIVL